MQQILKILNQQSIDQGGERLVTNRQYSTNSSSSYFEEMLEFLKGKYEGNFDRITTAKNDDKHDLLRYIHGKKLLAICFYSSYSISLPSMLKDA